MLTLVVTQALSSMLMITIWSENLEAPLTLTKVTEILLPKVVILVVSMSLETVPVNKLMMLKIYPMIWKSNKGKLERIN